MTVESKKQDKIYDGSNKVAYEKSVKYAVLRGASLVAGSLIYNVINASFTGPLKALDDACKRRDRGMVSTLWRDLVDALECSAKLSLIQLPADARNNVTTDLLSVVLDGQTIVLLTLELGELIYYMRGNDFTVELASTQLRR